MALRTLLSASALTAAIALTTVAASPGSGLTEGLTTDAEIATAGQHPAAEPTGAHVDEEPDCLQATPPHLGINGPIGAGDRISLDVLLFLDGPAQSDALPLLEEAIVAYDPMAIDLRIAEVRTLAPTDPDGARITDREADEAREAQSFIDRAKAQLGGGRPAHIDIVYVLTDVDIQQGVNGNGVAGLADCIGGVATDQTAFAVGEVSGEIDLLVTTFYREATAKIFAHEVGHLMGAHHHYQECGRPGVNEALAGGLGPCSLMTNFVDFQAINFGALNSSVVRAQAEAYATGND